MSNRRYDSLSAKDQESVLDDFVQVFSQYGRILETNDELVIKHNLKDADNLAVKKRGKALNDMAINRQRCVILNDKQFLVDLLEVCLKAISVASAKVRCEKCWLESGKFCN